MFFNKTTLIIFFICSTCNLLAQPAFEKTISSPGGLEGYSIANTVDNGFVITGYKRGGNQGVLLIKFDSTGDLEWERVILDSLGISGIGTGTKVIQTKDMGFLISGYLTNFPDPADILLIKTDSLGNVTWYKTIGEFDIDQPSDILESSSGNFFITGQSYYMGGLSGGPDAILLKVDNNGNLLSAHAFGGLQYDDGRKIIEIANKLLVFGRSSSFPPYGNIMYLTDTMGNILLAKSFRFSSSVFSDVALAPDSSILLAGISYDNFGLGNDTTLFLVKMDTSGNQLWIKTFNIHSLYYARSVKILNNGDITIAGNYRYNYSFLMQTDSLGNFKWTKSYGSSFNNFSQEIITFNNNGFIILASKYDTSTLQRSIYLIKTDSLGNTNCSSDIVTQGDTAIPIPYIVVSPNETIISNLLITNSAISIAQTDSAITICPFGTDVLEIFGPNNIFIYPNPFINVLSLNFNNDLDQKYYIQIFDQLGVLKYTAVSYTKFKSLNLDYFANGIYTMKISYENRYIIKRIIKINN